MEDVLHFLGGRDYPFEDLLRIQKKLNFIAGPHKERMHLMANEVHLYYLLIRIVEFHCISTETVVSTLFRVWHALFKLKWKKARRALL